MFHISQIHVFDKLWHHVNYTSHFELHHSLASLSTLTDHSVAIFLLSDLAVRFGSISVTNSASESHVLNRFLTLSHARKCKGVTRPFVTVGWFRKYWILNGNQNLNYELQVLNKYTMAHEMNHRCVFAWNENDSRHSQYNAFGFVGDRATPRFSD
jgi:hypothetical protein